MSDEDNNVVSFRAATPSARLKSLDWSDKRAHCDHKQIEVWEKEPIIECTDCGAVVDPYQWIRQRCHDWKYIMDRVAFEKREAAAEVEDLKKAIRLLRKDYKDEAEKRAAERALMVMPPRKRVKV